MKNVNLAALEFYKGLNTLNKLFGVERRSGFTQKARSAVSSNSGWALLSIFSFQIVGNVSFRDAALIQE